MQRYLRVVGTPVTLLLLLGFLLFGGWWGYKQLKTPAPPRPVTPCVSQSVGKALKTSDVSVRVLNGGTTTGLAGTVGTELVQLGFKVTRTGNTTQQVTTTQIVGNAATNPEVKLVAAFFPGATVKGDGRADHTVDVLVGNAYKPMSTTAPTTLPVNGDVCLPSPTASGS